MWQVHILSPQTVRGQLGCKAVGTKNQHRLRIIKLCTPKRSGCFFYCILWLDITHRYTVLWIEWWAWGMLFSVHKLIILLFALILGAVVIWWWPRFRRLLEKEGSGQNMMINISYQYHRLRYQWLLMCFCRIVFTLITTAGKPGSSNTHLVFLHDGQHCPGMVSNSYPWKTELSQD